MSRLDDELRNAFSRQQPPADFTARVLERVARQPAPRVSWWRRLAMLLEPPKLRWVAIGVTASLMLAIGAAQYSRIRQVAVNDNGKIAKAVQSEEKSVSPGGDNTQPDVTSPIPKSPLGVKGAGTSSTKHRLALARLRKEKELKERELRAEGEAAKEKLMLALSIASAALNDAQKAVHDDSPKP